MYKLIAKKGKVFSLCACIGLLTLSASSINAQDSSTDFHNKPIEEQWEIVQNEIDESLEMRNGKYAYNENEIKNIVSKLDINDFNVYTKKAYTSKSLSDEIIKSIKGVEIKPSTYMTVMKTCNYQGRDDGWNYYRSYSEHDSAVKWAARLKADANKLSLSGLVTDKIPGPYGKALGFSVSVGSVYYNGLANAITAKNKSCGVVADQNRFAPVYEVVSQKR